MRFKNRLQKIEQATQERQGREQHDDTIERQRAAHVALLQRPELLEYLRQEACKECGVEYAGKHPVGTEEELNEFFRQFGR